MLTEYTDMAGHLDGHRGQTGPEGRQPSPLLLLGGQRQKVTGAAHTGHSPGLQAHTHLPIADSPSADVAPLPARHPCPDPGHPRLPHRSPTRRLVQLEFVGDDTLTPHAHRVWGGHRHSLRSSCWHGAPHSRQCPR